MQHDIHTEREAKIPAYLTRLCEIQCWPCADYDRELLKNCPNVTCALWAHRPVRNHP